MEDRGHKPTIDYRRTRYPCRYLIKLRRIKYEHPGSTTTPIWVTNTSKLSSSLGGGGKSDSAGFINVTQDSMLNFSTLSSLKAPRTTLHSNGCSVVRRREVELDRSGTVQEANGLRGDLAELPKMIGGLPPGVGADGKDRAF